MQDYIHTSNEEVDPHNLSYPDREAPLLEHDLLLFYLEVLREELHHLAPKGREVLHHLSAHPTEGDKQAETGRQRQTTRKIRIGESLRQGRGYMRRLEVGKEKKHTNMYMCIKHLWLVAGRRQELTSTSSQQRRAQQRTSSQYFSAVYASAAPSTAATCHELTQENVTSTPRHATPRPTLACVAP